MSSSKCTTPTALASPRLGNHAFKPSSFVINNLDHTNKNKSSSGSKGGNDEKSTQFRTMSTRSSSGGGSRNSLKINSFSHEPTTPIDNKPLDTPGTVSYNKNTQYFFSASPPPSSFADNDMLGKISFKNSITTKLITQCNDLQKFPYQFIIIVFYVHFSSSL